MPSAPPPEPGSLGGIGSLALSNSTIVTHRFRLELAHAQREFVNLDASTRRAEGVNSRSSAGRPCA
jgi:hypothetical protein